MSDVPYATLVLGADATGLLKGEAGLVSLAKTGAQTEAKVTAAMDGISYSAELLAAAVKAASSTETIARIAASREAQSAADRVVAAAQGRLKAEQAAADAIARAARQEAAAREATASSYSSLRASLDPLYAASMQYERAVETVNAAVKAQIVTQEQANRVLGMAEQQMLGVTPAVQKVATAVDDVGKKSGFAAGGGMRMLGQQLSQVAQQGAVTGNYLGALAVQLPDIALGFGSVAIAASIVATVAIPAIVAAMGEGKTALEVSAKATETYADALYQVTADMDSAKSLEAEYAAAVISGSSQRVAALQAEAQVRAALLQLDQNDLAAKQAAAQAALAAVQAELNATLESQAAQLAAMAQVRDELAKGFLEPTTAMNALENMKAGLDSINSKLAEQRDIAKRAGLEYDLITKQIDSNAFALDAVSAMLYRIVNGVPPIEVGLNNAASAALGLSSALSQAYGYAAGLRSAIDGMNFTNIATAASNAALMAGSTVAAATAAGQLAEQRAKLAPMLGSEDAIIRKQAASQLASYAAVLKTNVSLQEQHAALVKTATAAGGAGKATKTAMTDAEKATKKLSDEIKKLEFDANPALKYNEQLEHLNELAANGLSDGAYRKAVKDLNDEFAKSNPTINKVGDAIGNFVASGLKDFKGLLSAFKNMIREMIATAIANPIRLALTAGFTGGGATGAAAQVAGGGAGGGGILAQIGGIGSSFVSGASGLVTALTGAGGGLATAGTYLSSVLGGATSSIAGFAAAAGAIALPLAAVAAVFSFFKTKTKELDTGMRITASSASILVEDFKRVEKSKFWGLSKKVKTTYSVSKNADPVEQAIDDIKNSGLALGSVLGLTAANFASFSSQIQISLKGLSDDQAKAEIARALGVIADQFSYAALGSFQVSMGNVIKDGETASAAMERLVSSLIAVNDVASLFGRGMIEMSVAGGVAASALVDLVGGLDAFNSKSAYVFSNMLTATEQSARKVAIATEQLNAGFAGLGVSIPKTHAQYMALMNAQNLMTESGRNTYAALLDMSAAFVEVNGTAQSAAQAAADLSQQASTLSKDIDTVNRTLSAMSRPIFDVTTAGRAMSASLVALMGGLDAFTSATSYFVANFYSDTEQLAISTRDLAAQFAAINVAVPASKEAFRALVNAQDLTTASGQALYAQLMALAPAFNDVSNATAAAAAAQAKAAADAKAAAAAQKAAAAQAKATAASKAAAAAAEAQAEAQRRANEAMQAAQKIADERRGLEDRYYEAIGDTVTMRNREVAALDASNQAFGRMVMQLEDAKKAADALNEGDFASQVAFNLARARAYGQIASAPTPSASYGGNVVPITPTTTTPTTTDPGLTALDAAEVMRLLALIERHTKDTAVSTDDLVDLQESA